jgi:peptidoglycan hydrolase-like protein with peptidoglycan-binding domain
MVSAALTASLAGPGTPAALASTRSAAFPAVPGTSVGAHPPTPFGLPPWIEGYAPLRLQTACDPTAKAGVLAFEQMVLRAYPDTASDGIVRACSLGGRSEHKEGRAWDWAVNAYDRHQAAEAAALLHWLLKPRQGHDAAMARRLGVMYIIWDRHIWGGYAASAGWRTYTGSEGHTDHVHFSFSWHGALKRTSFWKRTHWRPIAPGVVRRNGASYVSRGAHGPAVKAIQRALGVGRTGTFGVRTEHAVVAFQRSRGLGVDGVVGPQTWQALGQGYHRVAHRHARHHPPTVTRGRPTSQALTRPPRPGTWQHRRHWPNHRTMRAGAHHTVEHGATGWPVGPIQRVVGVRADEVFGPTTRAAVERFQSRHHLAADGVVGRRSWRALTARAHHVAAVHWHHEATTLRHYVAARHRVLLHRFAHRVLRRGDRGPAVRYVQRRVGVGVDGTYGPRTKAAVRTFQAHHHLVADGVVGRRTWRALIR